jgi:hypothetical protein
MSKIPTLPFRQSSLHLSCRELVVPGAHSHQVRFVLHWCSRISLTSFSRHSQRDKEARRAFLKSAGCGAELLVRADDIDLAQHVLALRDQSSIPSTPEARSRSADTVDRVQPCPAKILPRLPHPPPSALAEVSSPSCTSYSLDSVAKSEESALPPTPMRLSVIVLLECHQNTFHWSASGNTIVTRSP